jgi:hypothetical protein
MGLRHDRDASLVCCVERAGRTGIARGKPQIGPSRARERNRSSGIDASTRSIRRATYSKETASCAHETAAFRFTRRILKNATVGNEKEQLALQLDQPSHRFEGCIFVNASQRIGSQRLPPTMLRRATGGRRRERSARTASFSAAPARCSSERHPTSGTGVSPSASAHASTGIRACSRAQACVRRPSVRHR